MTWPETPDAGRLGDGRFASATDRPETIDALRQAVCNRVAQGYALYPQGGSTALDYGGIPRRPGVALDTRALSRVIDYPAADMTITVEAGITLTALRNVLAEQNQRLLIDAPQPDRATLGGIYATNASGPRRFGEGRPRDQILGVSFVTSGGALIKGGGRVVKNVAGYDFPRLLTGSLGTLGVIVQLTLKVRPRPEASAVAWVSMPGPDPVSLALDRLNTSGTRPIAIEVLNPSAARAVAGPLDLPANGWALVVGFEDNAPSVTWQVERLATELGEFKLVVREGTDAPPVWSALTEFQNGEIGGPVSLLGNLRPSEVVTFAAQLDPELWAVQVHAGNGIVRAHAAVPRESEALATEIDRLRALAVAGGGNLTLPRCPTEGKARLRVWGEARADWALAERVKKAFDPIGALNPGRFVGTI